MPIYPGAENRPVVNHGGPIHRPLMGIVVHHAVGNLDNAEARFNDPSSSASAHFGVAYDGSVRQWVDTDLVAYHACQANYTGWIGVEHESASVGDLFGPLTPEQVQATGGILKWLADTESVVLQVTDDIGSPGVAYHSMNPGDCSSHWGITGCPGAAIIGQRQAIVDAASGVVPPPPPIPEELHGMDVRITVAGSGIQRVIDAVLLPEGATVNKDPDRDVAMTAAQWAEYVARLSPGTSGSGGGPTTVTSTVTSTLT